MTVYVVFLVVCVVASVAVPGFLVYCVSAYVAVSAGFESVVFGVFLYFFLLVVSVCAVLRDNGHEWSPAVIGGCGVAFGVICFLIGGVALHCLAVIGGL